MKLQKSHGHDNIIVVILKELHSTKTLNSVLKFSRVLEKSKNIVFLNQGKLAEMHRTTGQLVYSK